MSFKKNKYIVIRKAISKDLSQFIANYFAMQKQVYDTCQKQRYFVASKVIPTGQMFLTKTLMGVAQI